MLSTCQSPPSVRGDRGGGGGGWGGVLLRGVLGISLDHRKEDVLEEVG